MRLLLKRFSFFYMWLCLLAAVSLACLPAGCAVMNMGQNLGKAVAGQDDPETVRDGAPAYLLLIDSMIEGDPNDEGTLIAGAKLYGLYAAVFVDDPARASRMANKGFGYAERALCESTSAGCGLDELIFKDFNLRLAEMGRRDVPALYAWALTRLVKARAESGDWSSVVALPKMEAALERVVELDATYEDGKPQMYLGILNSLLPPAMGGKPEKGRMYFEKALELSGGKNLAVQTAYARWYARMLYDRELHDRLLTEVVETDPHVPGLTLSNVLARREATGLLESADDYF